MLILGFKCPQFWLFVCVFMVFAIIPCSGQCIGRQCTFSLKNQTSKSQGGDKEIEAMAQQIKRIYWYYIGYSFLIYKSNIVVADRDTMHLLIFRNYIGTYIVIASKKKDKNQVKVNTFARIGAGFIGFNGESVMQQLKPFIIKINFSSQQLLLLDQDQLNLAEMAKKAANNKLIEEEKKNRVKEDIKTIDQYLKKEQDQFLRGAVAIDIRPFPTSFRTYYIITYINNTGTYLVIASFINDSRKIQLNNLVRMGGGIDTKYISIIKQQPY